MECLKRGWLSFKLFLTKLVSMNFNLKTFLIKFCDRFLFYLFWSIKKNSVFSSKILGEFYFYFITLFWENFYIRFIRVLTTINKATHTTNDFKRELASGKISELTKWSRNTPGDTQSVKTWSTLFLPLWYAVSWFWPN